MAVTLRDIGDKLQLSHSTVSRALRNDPQISRHTRALVQQTAAKMGYRVNRSARALANRFMDCVALIIPDVVDPFYARIVEGVDRALHQRGYAFILYVTHSDREREYDAVADAVSQRYSGTILFRRHLSTAYLKKAQRSGAPIVLLTQYEPGLPVDTIRVDDVDGGFKATDYLLQKGHTRVACITGVREQQESKDRLEGFHRAHARAGVAVDPNLIWIGDFQETSGVEHARRFAGMVQGERPTAVFAFNDRMAIGFLQAVQKMGFSVPEQLSIVGYDDIEPCRYTTPTLSTVRQPTRQMGEMAAEMIIRRLEDSAGPEQERLLKTTLQIRASSGPPPINNGSDSRDPSHR